MSTDDTTPGTPVDWSGAAASDKGPTPASTSTPDDTTVLESTTAPAVNPVRWSGRKTAVAAALALGLSSVGAVVVAAAHERGTTAPMQDGRPGGFPGQQGQQGPQGQLGQRGQRGQLPQQRQLGQQLQPGQVPTQPSQPGATTT